MKRIGRLVVTLFVALLFISVANLAARAQDATFNAKGDITLSPNALTAVRGAVRDEIAKGVNVSVRPAGLSKLQSGVDDLSNRMSRLEDNQYQLTLTVKDLNDTNRQAIAGFERKLGDSGLNWLWGFAILVIGVLLGLLFRSTGGMNTTNNYYGRDDASDRGPDGLRFALGRELEEGDEIIFRRHHPHTSHTEKAILGGHATVDLRFGEIPEPADKDKTIPVDEAKK